MSKTKEQVLIDKYGLAKGSYKYVPAGSEILKLIGQPVVLVKFTKGEDGQWTDKIFDAKINSICDFDLTNLTYNCKYVINGEEEEKEVRIIPEGFSWGDAEELGEMYRFVPYSIHSTMIEDELFLSRVDKLFAERETMKFEYLINITQSKTKEATLKYANHIGAAVKLEDGHILWIRFHELSLRHKNGTKYALRFANNDRSWSMIIDSNDKEFDFEGVGKFKIFDLAD